MSEEKVRREEFKVRGEALVEKVKELVHEGNIRRILIMDHDGKTLLDIPLTLGVLGALVAPSAGCPWRPGGSGQRRHNRSGNR